MTAFGPGIGDDQTSFRLFTRNYHALKRVLDANEEISTAIVAKNHHEIMEVVEHLLFNYLSAAMSLVEHTRRLSRQLYEKTNPKALEEIRKEIDQRFAQNETHQIIQGLRDYTQHRRLPLVGRAMSFSAMGDTPTLEAAYCLSTEPLLEWDKWKPLAKKKLSSLQNLTLKEQMFEHKKKDISVNQLITEHHRQVAEFYEWLGNKRREWLLRRPKSGSSG